MKIPLNTWISVKDAMPRKGSKVIVTNGDKSLAIAYVTMENSKKVFREETENWICEASHWMLLSKPSKT